MRLLGSAFAVFLSLASLAGLVACAPAAPAPASPELGKLKLQTILKSASFGNFYLSKDKGFYAKEGLDVDIVEMSGPVALAALSAGEIDYMTTAVYEFAAGAKGLPMKTVMFRAKRPAWYIIGGEGINSVNDLKGKAVGGFTAFGDVSYYAVRQGLRAAGLDPDKDVTYVPIQARPDKYAALRAKAVAASMFSAPDQLLAERRYGYKVLVSLGEVVHFPLEGLGTTDKKLKENPEQVRKMIRGTLKGMTYVRDNREDTLQYLMELLGLAREEAEAVYVDLVDAYTYDGLVSDKAVAELVDALLEAGLIPAELKGKVQVEKGLNTTLLKEVLKDFKP